MLRPAADGQHRQTEARNPAQYQNDHILFTRVQEWGGVVPALAKAAHEAAIDSVVASAVAAAGVRTADLAAVAVTIGPGLSLCLSVGALKARRLACENGLPIVPCHHMEAHALVARLGDAQAAAFPFLCLLVSGGHNLLLLARGVGDYVQVRSVNACAARWVLQRRHLIRYALSAHVQRAGRFPRAQA